MLSKTEKAHLNEFIRMLLALKNTEEAENLLYGVLTEKELREIPQRIQIVQQLKRGIPHQTIAERLGVGVSTVTRGSKELQKGHFKYV